MSALESGVQKPPPPAPADAPMFEPSTAVTLSGDEANSTLLALPPPELDTIAERIKGRDAELTRCNRQTAIDNGLDLLRAKAIAGHGQFEKWCRKNLSYSKSKAEKLIRLAEMLGPVAKSVGPTDLLPLDLLHGLSAPSTPASVRDAFVSRIINGEDIVAELRAALKKVRDERKGENRERAAAREAPDAPFDGCGGDRTGSEPRSEAYPEALSLLEQCIAQDLPRLMTFLAEAGRGRILTLEATRALEDVVEKMVEPGKPDAGDVVVRTGPVIYGKATGSGVQRLRTMVKRYRPLNLSGAAGK